MADEAAITRGVQQRPKIDRARYYAFADPSGGSVDSMTLAIAHKEPNGTAMLDILKEVKPPFAPDMVTQQFAETIKAYGLRSVTGDRYGGEWPRERFRTHGVQYETSDMNRSELYASLLPMLNSGTVSLLDNAMLADQLCGLERRAGRSGKDTIDHPPGAHDDLANAAAGALVMTTQKRKGYTLEDIRRACDMDDNNSKRHYHTAAMLGFI